MHLIHPYQCQQSSSLSPLSLVQTLVPSWLPSGLCVCVCVCACACRREIEIQEATTQHTFNSLASMLPEPSASKRSNASLISCFCSSVSSFLGAGDKVPAIKQCILYSHTHQLHKCMQKFKSYLVSSSRGSWAACFCKPEHTRDKKLLTHLRSLMTLFVAPTIACPKRPGKVQQLSVAGLWGRDLLRWFPK